MSNEHHRTRRPTAFRFDEAHYEHRNLTNNDDEDLEGKEDLSTDSEHVDGEDDEESSSDEDDHYFRQSVGNDSATNVAAASEGLMASAEKNPPPPPPGRPTHTKSNNNNHHHHRHRSSHGSSSNKQRRPSLEPYLTRLEKFELFSTNQCYYLVACDKHSTGYRIMKMDRTLIERPKGSGSGSGGLNAAVAANNSMADSSTTEHQEGNSSNIAPTNTTHADDASTISEEKNIDTKNKTPSSPPNQQQPPLQQSQNQQTFRRLSEFVFEDPAVYTQSEIKDILDMINDGNRNGMGGTASSATAASGGAAAGGEGEYLHHQHLYGGSASSSREYDGGVGNGQSDHSINRTGSVGSISRHGGGNNNNNNNNGGGLKPICKAYGVLGFIRFLDCYYLTLITKRAKVGSIGGNSIYTIKSTETFPLKPAERTDSTSTTSESAGHDPLGLLSMWQRGKRSVGLGLTNREIAELRYQGE